MFDDWQRLHQELAAYRVLCDEYDTGYSFSNWKKLSDDFEHKRDKLLAANGFKTWNKKHDDDWRFPDTGDEYSNDYLYVLFQNFNLRREYASEHWYTDIHEELP